MGEEDVVSVHNPIQLADDQEPEPDLAVIQARNYGDELPGAADVLLLIEVADSTLSYDRGRKLPMYAGAEVPEAWLIDLPGEAIERQTNPVGGSYRVTMRVGRGEEVASLAVSGLVLKVGDVLG